MAWFLYSEWTAERGSVVSREIISELIGLSTGRASVQSGIHSRGAKGLDDRLAGGPLQGTGRLTAVWLVDCVLACT